jgi:DNA invertase Pin-like site-specific DNA recombinase
MGHVSLACILDAPRNVEFMTLYGYARVSTDDQELHLQLDALKHAGCNAKHIFSEKVSGAKHDRPALTSCLSTLKKGDTLLVWRLDRLGRSMPHLVGLVEDLRQRGIGFRSVCDGVIDTTTASGELVFNIFSSLAQFERRLTQERTHAGLQAARARGKKGGRKPIKADNPRVKMAKTLYEDKQLAIHVICKQMQISRSTFYRLVSLI